MIRLIVVITILVPIISGAHICAKDGLFENPEDKTSYFECTDGKSFFKSCPLADDGLSYKIFDGQSCIESHPTFVCPQQNGNYRYMNNERQYYECVDSKPVLKNCPEDSKFDGLECVSTITNDDDEFLDQYVCPGSNGLFYNPEERHSYYECIDSVPHLRDCPRESSGHRSGSHHKHVHRKRMVFDGEQCVPQHRTSRDGRQSRQAPPEWSFQCPEPDGYFEDPSDPYNYYTCRNNIPRTDRCPENRRFNATLKQCIYAPTYFIGPDIRPEQPVVVDVPVVDDVTCPAGSTYDSSTGRCIVESLIDPYVETQPVLIDRPSQPVCPEGTTYDRTLNKCRRETYVDPYAVQPPVFIDRPVPECPSGYTYDSRLEKCSAVTLVDPISRPRVIEPERQCPADYVYDRRTGRCMKETFVDPVIPTRCPFGSTWDYTTLSCIGAPVGRFRRNGRVETEDRINGAVIVDIWNERQWKWDRNPNGQRILPDVNGWLDRSMAYRQGGRPYVSDQYKRQPAHKHP